MNLETFLTIRHLKTSPAEVVKRLETESEKDLYRATLAVQNELIVSESLRFLGGNSKWLSSKTVLDMGCGPGDLIASLSRHFPDKSYTGIDINADFVALAREQTGGMENCRFYHADLHEFSQGRYDFIILRAVLQHLKDPDRLMNHLSNLLTEKGSVLFIDTPRENFIDADPPLVCFNEFYDRLEAIQKEHTGSRDCMAELEERLAKTDFKLIESLAPLIPVTGAERRIKLVQFVILACTLTGRMMPIMIDLHDLFTDLINWHDEKNSRLNFKSRMILIEST